MFMDLADQPGKTVARSAGPEHLVFGRAQAVPAVGLGQQQAAPGPGWRATCPATRVALVDQMPAGLSTHRVRCPPFVEDDALYPPGLTDGGRVVGMDQPAAGAIVHAQRVGWSSGLSEKSG
jgi:hypothetical protein